MIQKTILLLIIFNFIYHFSYAQTAIVFGKVVDSTGKALRDVSVSTSEANIGAYSDSLGKFQFPVPAGKKIAIRISSINFDTINKTVPAIKEGEKYNLGNITLKRGASSLPNFIVHDNARTKMGTKIDITEFKNLPTPVGGVEQALKVIGGLPSNNEMSSQYSVHGGNFDENLVYVNDFEIYRPFLPQSGEQEGLSFINEDLVGSMFFSEGGFEAKYGDKMSSVLDIQYKKPKDFEGTVDVSLLGGSVHLEGISKNKKFTYLVGFRDKSNQYLLNSLDIKGNYQPSAQDFQGLLTYKVSDKWQLEAIGNISSNRYLYQPQSQVTTFGVVNAALQLNVFYDGQELDQFTTAMGGLSATCKPNKNLTLKFLTSAYTDKEDETFDIDAQYYLGEVQSNLGQSNFGQVVYSLGAGELHDWGRNYLNATVANIGQQGSYIGRKQFLQWGVQFQHEIVNSKLDQWEMVDSSFYNIPYSTTQIQANSVYKSTDSLTSNRYSGFIQDSWNLDSAKLFTLIAGVRFSYWDVNKEFLVSPRVQFSYAPRWKRDIVFRAAVGEYDQPPFYRELQDLDGNIHLDVLAQKSTQFVIGSDYNFTMWNRPFKFITEAYYKLMRDLNPYDINDVRINYFATNNAKGYAEGIDFRLHGQFTKELESWISLSILNTKENIGNNYYYNYTYKLDTINGTTLKNVKTDSVKVVPGYIPRPSDQHVTVGLFFQDYLPGHENFKVYLNLLFGSGFPTGPPGSMKYRDSLWLPAYRRLDIGFSTRLLDGTKQKNANKVWGKLKSVWLSLEVFNLLQIPNTIDYLWVKDNSGNVFAVPNYLTSRRVNARLIVKF